MLPNCGAGAAGAAPRLQSPQRAPRPNMKFLMPLQPLLRETIVAINATVKMRLFIDFCFTCIARVFGSIKLETAQNYDAIDDVQMQHRFFSATMCCKRSPWLLQDWEVGIRRESGKGGQAPGVQNA